MPTVSTGSVSAVVAAATIAGCGGGEPGTEAQRAATASSGRAISVALVEEAKSGLRGTATLRSGSGNTFAVVLELPDAKDGSYYPAHIHRGTCAEYRKITDFNAQLATVVDELQDVVDGRSESTIYTARLAERLQRQHSINVHEPTGPYAVIACGDLPRR